MTLKDDDLYKYRSEQISSYFIKKKEDKPPKFNLLHILIISNISLTGLIVFICLIKIFDRCCCRTRLIASNFLL